MYMKGMKSLVREVLPDDRATCSMAWHGLTSWFILPVSFWKLVCECEFPFSFLKQKAACYIHFF